MDWTSYRNKILSEVDSEAFFLNEFPDMQRRGTEAKAHCPWAAERHEGGADANPSFTINLSKGVYYCATCHTKGNVHTFLRERYHLTNEEAWLKLGDALNIERPSASKPTRPPIETGLVSSYHQSLMKLTGPLREILRNRRGLTDDTLRQFQLGWDGERVTIPIYDEFNELVNFRRYKWDSTDDKWKVLNYTDELGNAYGEVRIFGIDRVVDDNYEYVVWSEGEMDRIICEQHGFPTACPTSGAGTWKPEWGKLFRHKKRVYLAQDNDEAGRLATKKLCEKLYRVVDVYIINWPEDFPIKGDITDFFTKCGQTSADFQALLDGATKYEDDKVQDRIADESEAIEVHLADAAGAELLNKRIRVPVMVSGKDTTPYICPKRIKISCGDACDGGKNCKNCGLALHAGEIIKEYDSINEEVLKMIRCTDKQQKMVIFDSLDINLKCLYAKLEVLEYMNLEELRLIPKAEASFGFAKSNEYVVRNGYYIGKSLKTNKLYTMAGYLYADPQTQYATYMFDKAIPDKDIIEDFEMTPDVYEQLTIFQPKEGQTIREKFNEIHTDLEQNVTYTWERRNVAFAVDLIYHTVLNFYFQEQFVKRGWGELLIIGDSGQAKTTLVERLMAHYRLGELHSGESSKRTGLVYSIQQNSRRWFLVWGAFPLNDGGLITLDELSGLDEADLAQMSDVRSSGIAKSTGVITAETTSRTRAIFISNPRNGKQLNTETYGCMSILKLFGKSEDVRRLDLAMCVASGDVDPQVVNRDIRKVKRVPHIYTSDLCNLRVLWAWSRKPEDVDITDEALERILEKATYMGQKYSSKVPIVESADQRLKIARLSIACACCMFSTEDGNTVIVKPEHVDFVVDFMEELYCSKAMGYDRMSADDMTSSDDSDEALTELRQKFLLLPLQDTNEMASILFRIPYFSRNTLEDYTGLAREDLRALLKFLTNNNLVEKYKGDYRRLPLGTALFTNLVDNPVSRQEIDYARSHYYGVEEM